MFVEFKLTVIVYFTVQNKKNLFDIRYIIYLYKNEGQVIISFSVRIRSPTKFDILHNHYRKFKKIFIR